MSGIRLYFDADAMQRAVLAALRARGIDAIRALDVGLTDAEHETHLQFATSQDRVLFSFNVGDFHRIHSEYALCVVS